MFPPIDGKGNDKIDTTDERKAFDSVDDTEKAEKGDKKVEKEKEELEDVDEIEDEIKDENEEEDKVDDDEEDEEKEEELEEDTLYQAIKKHDKELFKKIPELKHVIFREQKYTEYFPSIEDAKNAKEVVETFEQYEQDLMKGDSSNLLESLEKTDKKALERFVSNFIPTLQKQSNDLYLNMIYPEIKKLFRAAVKSGDERLANSAKNLNWFVFGDTDTNAEAGFKAQKEDEKDDDLSKRERAFEERIVSSFTSDVMGVGSKRLEKVIGSAFAQSDMSPLLQKSLTKEIKERVSNTMEKDARHMGNMNNLWAQARKNGFTSEWKDRITNAYLSRAKLLIPKVRQQVLSEAKVNAKNIASDEKRPTRIPSSGGTYSGGGGKVDSKKVDWSKTSERDALDGKIIMRK